MTTLPREVYKWLQSLDLTYPVRNTRRDFSNGYLIAEIFSCYYPQEIHMHSFDNGTSIETKTGNWSIIQRFFQCQEFGIPREEIEGTIHCKPGAASLLIQKIFTIITNRTLPAPTDDITDFSDNSYQQTLPFHARSTATQAIKNNIADSELHTDPDNILCGQKAECIIRMHTKNRKEERKQDPDRFGINQSLCERCPRSSGVIETSRFNSEAVTFEDGRKDGEEMAAVMHVDEVQVKQHNYTSVS